MDIGGGSGHDVARLKQEFPDLACNMILQDLPSVVQGVSLPGIEVMPHNMFERQPVKDAGAFYMQTVLHDWPDKQAHEVLAKTREAMGKHSILLINENVLSEDTSDDTPVVAHIDFTMVLNFSSREPTEQVGRSLAEGRSQGCEDLETESHDQVEGTIRSNATRSTSFALMF